MLYFETVSVFMHDVAIDSVPPNVCDLLTLSNQIRPYHARFSSSDNLFVKPPSLKSVRDSSFKYAHYCGTLLVPLLENSIGRNLKIKFIGLFHVFWRLRMIVLICLTSLKKMLFHNLIYVFFLFLYYV